MKLHSTAPYILNPNHNIAVTLIGAGGTGSLMLSRLARLHHALIACGKVGLTVSVFDNDRVEEYNVGRQMFTVHDVGEYKSLALVNKINRSFNTTFKAITEKFTTTKSAKAYLNDYDIPYTNIYITAVDNAPFRIQFQEYFKREEAFQNTSMGYQKPYYWMDLGNTKVSGQCILGSTNIEQPNTDSFIESLPTVIDRFPNLSEMDTPEIQGNGCSYQSKLEEQSLFVNDALTAMAAPLLEELLVKGYIANGGFFMNLANYKTNPLTL